MLRRMFAFLILANLSMAFVNLCRAEEKNLGVKIPMRDGRFLAADIILPSSEGTFPVIYIHTPYGRKTAAAPLPDSPFSGELLDREHYGYVVTDWRGFNGSRDAGAGISSPQHGLDGYDVIEWIAKQPWSNGKVGLWGHSAVGAVQYKIAAEKPPHLVCAVCASSNIGAPYEQYYYGGVLQKHYLEVISGVGHSRYGRLSLVKTHPAKDWLWIFASKNEYKESRADIPMLFMTGWYDSHPDIKIDTFNKIRTHNKRNYNNMKLLIGPWHHTAFGIAKQGVLEFSEAEGITTRQTLRFFDYWLRDQKDNGWDREPPIRYFQMGSNAWHGLLEWPPGITAISYYLRDGGRLLEYQPENESPDTFQHNPDNPVPTVGGANISLKQNKLKILNALDAGPQDLSEKIESRNDVLVYTTDTLSQDIDVIGAAQIEVFLSSSSKDTDVAARLSDVYPDGRSILVSDGIWRMRFRESLKKSKFMIANQVYAVTIPLMVTGQTFLGGHKIRISISSSNYPRFDINPLKAANTIYHDKTHPSVLRLPALPMIEKTD